MNWMADAEPVTFDGGEFCWAALEIRDCTNKGTGNGNPIGAYAKWHQEPVRNQSPRFHSPLG
jgi:hypothetical protein